MAGKFCKHYRGMHEKDLCEAGIAFATLEHRGTKEFSDSCPCFGPEQTGKCESKVYPTAEEVAFRVPECINVFGLLREIAKGIDYTEHGILYSCATREGAPPEVPSGHKWLLMPAGFVTR